VTAGKFPRGGLGSLPAGGGATAREFGGGADLHPYFFSRTGFQGGTTFSASADLSHFRHAASS